ncbi:MAG: polysaccharide deacetylase [Butyrivibrio sp.]|nr:polysaccharide deacetylase [Butyrivibrio sp.]
MQAENGAQNNDRQPSERVARLRKMIIGTISGAIIIPLCVSVALAVTCDRLSASLKNAKADLEWYHEHYQERTLVVDQESTMILDGSLNAQEEEQTENDEQSPVTEDTDDDDSDAIDDIRRVYLTFDDGPSIYTGEILDILKEYNVKATFFVVGREQDKYLEMYERITDEGHSIGMHSYSHKYGEIYSSLDNFQTDLHKLQTFIYENTGVWTNLYRFPGGSSNKVSDVDMAVLIDYLNKSNITYFDWNVSCGDADSGKTKDEIVNNVMSSVDKYSNVVILMHDAADKHTTVEALPEIIEQIQQMDATVIVPITEDTLPVQHIKNK